MARTRRTGALYLSRPGIARHTSNIPNVTAHAAIHVVVQNQIAMNFEQVIRAMHRPTKGGLTRHDAIHAIDSGVAGHLFDILNTRQSDDVDASQARYLAAVERVTVTGWRQGRK